MSIDQSAKTPQRPARPGGEFFLRPDSPAHRRYEALRAYLAEGLPAAEAAARFGYTPASLVSAVRDFRAGAREFFTAGRPGPKTAPGKDAARPRILELRAAGHSIDEIAAALAAEGTPLNRTGIAEVIAAEGLPRLWRRPDADRGGVAREIQPRAEALDFSALPERAETRLAGLLLAVPDLIALGIPDMITAAGYPSTPNIPALSYVLSLLALKLTATRRVSHVYDIAADPGAALFAALTALPKATALTTYSYRLQHRRQAAFLAALDKASLAAGLATGEALNLDFHAVMHWGEDAALERHYVPSRSQRTRSVLTFFAEDAGTHTLLYANADLAKATQNREVIAFADHWKTVTGHDPALLIFDSKLTTQAVLAELDDRHIAFITLRARHPGVTAALAALPASAWTAMTLARA
ncbi:MAG: helix-turn-helix domain-containing protein, partial [Streptosporangiaceae bacterium]